MNIQPRKGDWIQTCSGRQFWPMDPRPEDIHPEDIAHALSMLCRYAGHCNRFYSVAEHCCLLHDVAERQDRPWALLHDASEAYLADVPRPVKPFLPGYAEAEAVVMRAVAARFRLLPFTEPASVKELDGRILVDEAQQNMSVPPAAWDDTGSALGVTLQLWSPPRAETEFLRRFQECVTWN